MKQKRSRAKESRMPYSVVAERRAGRCGLETTCTRVTGLPGFTTVVGGRVFVAHDGQKNAVLTISVPRVALTRVGGRSGRAGSRT